MDNTTHGMAWLGTSSHGTVWDRILMERSLSAAASAQYTNNKTIIIYYYRYELRYMKRISREGYTKWTVPLTVWLGTSSHGTVWDRTLVIVIIVKFSHIVKYFIPILCVKWMYRNVELFGIKYLYFHIVMYMKSSN